MAETTVLLYSLYSQHFVIAIHMNYQVPLITSLKWSRAQLGQIQSQTQIPAGGNHMLSHPLERGHAHTGYKSSYQTLESCLGNRLPCCTFGLLRTPNPSSMFRISSIGPSCFFLLLSWMSCSGSTAWPDHGLSSAHCLLNRIRTNTRLWLGFCSSKPLI